MIPEMTMVELAPALVLELGPTWTVAPLIWLA